MRSEAGERKRAQPHRSNNLWSRRHFYLPPEPPSAPQSPAVGCDPHHTHSLSAAHWLHVNFLETMTALRDPCGSVATTSNILSFAPDAHVRGAWPPFPCPLKNAKQSSTLGPHKPRPP